MATVSLTTHIQPRTPQGGFANEPFVNFKTPASARAMQAALDQIASQLGREYDLIIGGRSLKTEGKIRSFNPARPSQVIGVHQKAAFEFVAQQCHAMRSRRQFNRKKFDGLGHSDDARQVFCSSAHAELLITACE